MGLKPTVFRVEYPDILMPNPPVFIVSISHFYNFVQEGILHPHRYVFYDLRPQREFMARSIRGAVWGWEGHRPSQKAQDTAATEKFYGLLQSEVEGKTVVAFSDEEHPRHLHTFFHHMKNANCKPRLSCALREGFVTLSSLPRYAPLLSDASIQHSGPIEILPPYSLKKTRPRAALFVSGVDVLVDQVQMLKHFGIVDVINVSGKGIRLDYPLQIVTYSSKFGTPDLIEVSRTIRSYIKQQKPVLIVDDFAGREYAVTSCVAYFVTEGVPIQEAIQFVKEKKPSADMNHLMAVHSIVQSAPIVKTGACRALYKRPAAYVRIPPHFLDKWDEERLLVEEVVERVPAEEAVRLSPETAARRFELKGRGMPKPPPERGPEERPPPPAVPPWESPRPAPVVPAEPAVPPAGPVPEEATTLLSPASRHRRFDLGEGPLSPRPERPAESPTVPLAFAPSIESPPPSPPRRSPPTMEPPSIPPPVAVPERPHEKRRPAARPPEHEEEEVMEPGEEIKEEEVPTAEPQEYYEYVEVPEDEEVPLGVVFEEQGSLYYYEEAPEEEEDQGFIVGARTFEEICAEALRDDYAPTAVGDAALNRTRE